MRPFTGRAIGVGLALLGDRFMAEPPNTRHPVAWFGSLMQSIEDELWSDDRRPGLAYAAAGAGIGATAGRAIRSTAAMTAIAVGGTELRRIAAAIANALAAGETEDARHLLPSLVGRDVSDLDETGMTAAVIESVAENTVDASIAPMLWAVVLGAPGAGAYRAINTMDAMVGHRSTRYEKFGWAAARLDDVANWIPARVFAALVAAQSPGRSRQIAAIAIRDGAAHPSPNAGVAEAAMAAALQRRLGGPLRYGDRHEARPTLGRGPRPDVDDLERAITISARSEVLLAAVLISAALISEWRHR